jgi:transcriptional regulator with XRE-family HTH domain
MTPAQYRALRIKLGSQPAVAAMLGIDPQTISRRERGELPINKEAEMALRAIPAAMTRRMAEKMKWINDPANWQKLP